MLQTLARTRRTPPRRDPTRTLGLRGRFGRALAARLQRLVARLIAAVRTRQRWGPALLVTQQEPAEAPGWLERFLQGAAALISAELLLGRWWEPFVQSGYRTGWRQSAGPLRRRRFLPGPSGPEPLGPVGPPSTAALTSLLTLAESRMEALAQTTLQAVREAVSATRTHGVARLTQAVRELLPGLRRRGRALTETTTIGAHATGTLDALEQAGVQQVVPEIEAVRLTTAGDARVCRICRALAGRVYPIAQARGVVPLHPSCRCAWRAVRVPAT